MQILWECIRRICIIRGPIYWRCVIQAKVEKNLWAEVVVVGEMQSAVCPSITKPFNHIVSLHIP